MIKSLSIAGHLIEVARTNREVFPGNRWEPREVETRTELFCNGRRADPEKHTKLVERVWERGR